MNIDAIEQLQDFEIDQVSGGGDVEPPQPKPKVIVKPEDDAAPPQR